MRDLSIYLSIYLSAVKINVNAGDSFFIFILTH